MPEDKIGFDSPETKALGAWASAYTRRRKKLLDSLSPDAKKRLAFKIYQKVVSSGENSGRHIIVPYLNEITFKSTGYKIENTSTRISKIGGWNDLIWGISVAAEEVFSDEAARM